MKASGIGDTIYVGPEAEFFVFDDVKYKADPYNTGFKLDSSELPSNDDTDYEAGNLGHRPRVKGGYFPVPPIDQPAGHALRNADRARRNGCASSKSTTTKSLPPSTSLASSSTRWSATPTRCRSTNTSCTRSPHAYGKTATFMPKPIFGDNGSGMHVHQSIWKDGKPTVRRRRICRPVGDRACTTSAASSSTPRRSTRSPTR